MRSLGHTVRSLSVNYQQRHVREIAFARQVCRELDVEHQTIEIPGLAKILGENALTSHDAAVPTGVYQDQTIRATTVPNRNMILLSIAIGAAVAGNDHGVAFGAHAGIQTNYPDCGKPFADAMHQVAQVCDWKPIAVHAPFIDWTKDKIVRRAAELGVPFHLTWSCYNGRELHCGQCSTCMDRRHAFREAGVADPTQYEVSL